MVLRKTLALAVVLAACHDGSKGADGGPAGNVSYANIKLSPPPSVSGGRENVMVCRAINVTGSVQRIETDAGVATNDVVGDGFVHLGLGTHLAVKNGTTTREVLFDGPGDVRVCVGAAEEMWLNGGMLTSVVGAGESPGAEVWVVTPHGVVRYGSGARVRVTVVAGRTDIALSGGNAFAYAVDAVSVAGKDASVSQAENGWYPVPLLTTFSLVSKDSPSRIAGECEKAANAAHDLATAIATHDASISEAAPKHVILRQAAHATCAVAELVVSRSLDPVERERLLPRVNMASARWR